MENPPILIEVQLIEGRKAAFVLDELMAVVPDTSDFGCYVYLSMMDRPLHCASYAGVMMAIAAAIKDE